MLPHFIHRMGLLLAASNKMNKMKNTIRDISMEIALRYKLLYTDDMVLTLMTWFTLLT